MPRSRKTKKKAPNEPYTQPTRPLFPPIVVGATEHLKSLEEHKISDAAVIIVTDTRENVMPGKTFHAMTIIVNPPDKNTAFMLGEEVHFVLCTPEPHIYVLSTQLEIKKRREMPTYPVPSLNFQSVTTRDALLYGIKYTPEEYKDRYAHRLWMPTREEYIAWIKACQTGATGAYVVRTHAVAPPLPVLK